MTALRERLRDVDRRVLREDKYRDPVVFARVMSRWWVWYVLGTASCLGGLILVRSFPEGALGALGFGLGAGSPGLLLLAGGRKVEHDRLQGRDRILGLRRPPGL